MNNRKKSKSDEYFWINNENQKNHSHIFKRKSFITSVLSLCHN